VYLTLAALILFLPVVHYWYVLWAIPFMALFPGLSWLVLSFTSGAYFFSVFSVAQGEAWMLPVWAMWIIWLPFLLLLAYEMRLVILRRFCPDKAWRKPETLAVVVPALNEENHIATCLSSLKAMQPPPDEIVVCDGGSHDRTISIAETMHVRVVMGGPGRGAQIRTGIAAISSDVVLVIHADCRCGADVRRRIMAMLERNADVIGGAVGQRFMDSSAKLLLIELLNDVRATFAGASFGDQGQFFRITAVESMNGFPDYPLMEDVELSLRLNRIGRVVLLDGDIRNSERQWKQHFFKRIGLVLKLVFIFHVNRFLRRDVTKQLYAKYYNRKRYRGCDNIQQK
jgi:glycosyltransferase involved in cell wall biosynthesis